ncbi:MAG: LamG domain-containing protein [Bacteroidota bacterium]|nr:LamG domain-containing protein [Bacteroidota bacterium]
MNRIVFLFALLIIILGLNCNQYKDGVIDPGTNHNIGKVSISISQAPDEVTSVIATLSRRGFEDRILILTISDKGQSAWGEFTDVPIGMWHLKVDARNDLGIVRYSGERDVEVLPGQTSVVELELLSTSGGIEIHVTWGGKCTTPPSGLVSWWSGDGTANDVAGSNHGMLMNGATFGQGKVRRAFSFDGIDDYVRIPHSPSLNPSGSFSVEAWIYLLKDAWGVVIAKWGDIYDWRNQRSWVLCVRDSLIIEFSIGDSTQKNYIFHYFATPPWTLKTKVWTHIAGVYDHSSGTHRIYANGIKVAEKTEPPIVAYDGIADVAIGAALNASFLPKYFFPGLIDEVSFYHRALSEKEVRNIYNAGVSGKCR